MGTNSPGYAHDARNAGLEVANVGVTARADRRCSTDHVGPSVPCTRPPIVIARLLTQAHRRVGAIYS